MQGRPGFESPNETPMAASNPKQRNRRAAADQKRRRRRSRPVLLVLGLAAVLALVGWYAWRESNRPGVAVESMGRTHLAPGMSGPQYNSSPPTSGPHTDPARWGEHLREIPHVNQIHNLEHGGVLIQYNCEHEALQGRCEDVRQALRTLLNTAREDIDPKVILAPYARMTRPIALTAWTRLQYLDIADGDAIFTFIRRNINHAPELVE